MDGANGFVGENLGIKRSDLGFEADCLEVIYVLSKGLSAWDLGIIECGQYYIPKPDNYRTGWHGRRPRISSLGVYATTL